jgi:hypothetical protein
MTAEELEKRLKATEDALKELEKRVRVTEDIQQIHELQRRYVNALICTEWDDCADCFDGDRAKGKWLLYMMYCYPHTGQSLFWVQGFYNMEYVRENGKWKISYMNWTERMGLPGGGPPQGLW